MNGSLVLLFGIWVFAPLEWREYRKNVFHLHTPLLLCGKITCYHRSSPFADGGVVLIMINTAS